MRENRTYGSEGGGAELNRLSLPLSIRPAATSGGMLCERGSRAYSSPHAPREGTRNDRRTSE